MDNNIERLLNLAFYTRNISLLISAIRSYGLELHLLNYVDAILLSSRMLLGPLVLPFWDESIFPALHRAGATVSGGIYSQLDPHLRCPGKVAADSSYSGFFQSLLLIHFY